MDTKGIGIQVKKETPYNRKEPKHILRPFGYRRGGVACVLCFLITLSITAVLFYEDKYIPHRKSIVSAIQKYAGDIFSSAENTTVAHQTNFSARVICMILTTPSNWKTKGVAVLNTWAPRCHKAIFFYTKLDNCTSHPICNESRAVGLNVPDGRSHLTAKTLGALNYSYSLYAEDADYFLKADDDTYVIMENLQRAISRFNFSPLLYLGRKFEDLLPKGYNSGGAGYIIGKEAAKLLLFKGTKFPKECPRDGGYEDHEIGKCLAKFGVFPSDDLDANTKLVFHSENPFRVLQGDPGPSSYSYINIKGAEFGNRKRALKERGFMLSNWTATLHYVTPAEMYMYDFLLYHLKRRDGS